MNTKKIGRETAQYAFHIKTSPQFNMPLHTHNSYEFLLVKEGAFCCNTQKKSYILSTGDMVITAPGEPHFITFPEPCTYSRQILQIRPEFVRSAVPDIINTIDSFLCVCGNYIPAKFIDKYCIDDIFSEISEYITHLREETDSIVLYDALRLITKIGEISKYEDISDKMRVQKSVRKILEYIDLNFTSPITLKTLSNYMYMDKSYLCRLFKCETGTTINFCINSRRIELAKKLLSDGTAAGEVYKSCGFNGYSTFYREFLKHTNITPEQFKNQL